jgi:lycopene beta-cyclase
MSQEQGVGGGRQGRAAPSQGGREFDYLFIGGGLANALVALAVRARRPDARLAVVEAGERYGGNHTWSFHETDLDGEGLALLAPLVIARWTAVKVAFPDGERRLQTGYAATTGQRVHQLLLAALQRPGSQAVLGTAAVRIGPHDVQLADGRRLSGQLVIDGRGPQQPAALGNHRLSEVSRPGGDVRCSAKRSCSAIRQ